MTSRGATNEGAFAPINRDRAFEGVVSQIEAAILNGTYKVGDNLPSERELLEQFQVGRSTVREALRILESMGLVRTSQGSRKGAEVAGMTMNSLARSLHSAVAMRGVPLVDLVEYRMIAGATGNFLAARDRTDEHLTKMENAITQMHELVGDAHAFARADVAFHSAILEAAGNALLQIISSVVESSVIDLIADRVSDADNEAVRASFIEQHVTLLTAIRDRQGEEAARIAQISLYETYAPLLEPKDRDRIAVLVDAGAASFNPAHHN